MGIPLEVWNEILNTPLLKVHSFLTLEIMRLKKSRLIALREVGIFSFKLFENQASVSLYEATLENGEKLFVARGGLSYQGFHSALYEREFPDHYTLAKYHLYSIAKVADKMFPESDDDFLKVIAEELGLSQEFR